MSRTNLLRLTALVAALGLLAGAAARAKKAPAGDSTLRPPATFDSISDPAERSVAIFEEAGKVLLHPRCINCHPAGDSPLQGEGGRHHQPPVRRGVGGLGVPGMRCTTCHMGENYDPGRVPGAPHWLLAPRKMAWQGLSLGELCRQIKDPARNGGRTLEQILEHMSEDGLVGWAWSPGEGREAAPGSQESLGALISAWIETGAACPAG